MTEDLRAIIATLPRERRDPRLAGVRATYRFELVPGDSAGGAPREGGSVHLRVDDGLLEIVEGAGGDADTTMVCNEDDFRDVLLGEQNLLTAVLQGRIDVRGDLEKFFVFHQLLKVAQRARRERGAKT
jgi:hypothetical protein